MSNRGWSIFFALILGMASLGMFGFGAFMFLFGMKDAIVESASENGSAIRHTVYAVQYGTGAVLMVLSLILGALAVLIGMRSRRQEPSQPLKKIELAPPVIPVQKLRLPQGFSRRN